MSQALLTAARTGSILAALSFVLLACGSEAPPEPEPQGESTSHLEGGNECRYTGFLSGGTGCKPDEDCLWLDGKYRCRARPPESQGPWYDDEAKAINPTDCTMQGHECGACAPAGVGCKDNAVCVYGHCAVRP